jgi:AraC-like DNA-binding protein
MSAKKEQSKAAEKEAKRPKGLENVDDETLATLVKEAVRECNFDSDSIAQAAFRELQRRTPE